MTAETTTPGMPVNAGGLRRHRNLVTALLLALAAWCLYLPSLRYGFIYYDDVRILKDHPELYGQAHFSDNLRGIFVTYFPREEPLLVRDVSWALDSQLFGFGNQLGYHLSNVVLHGVVVAMLFGFLLVATCRYRFALAVSVAWLVLAVHTEPVAWIMGRKDILSALFMLLALCAQTHRLTARTNAARYGWFAVTLSCFVLGLLSKISVLTFPLVLFLHALFFPYLRGERKPDEPFPWRRTLLREGSLCLPAFAVSGAIYVWYQRTLAQMGVFDRGYTAHGLDHAWNLVMVNPLVFWLYLRQIFLPANLALFYTSPTLKAVYPLWQMALSAATAAAIGGFGVWLFRKRKDLFFYFGAFIVLMVPYLNLIFMAIWVADRYVYFASFCVLALAMALAAGALQREQRRIRIAVFTAGALFAGVNLMQKLSYQPAWRNGETLWQYHITLPHPALGAFENLAAYYYADATASQGTPAMATSMQKMALVVKTGLDEFWPDRNHPPPPTIAHLLFLQAIVQEVGGQPNAALASLLLSDQLRPRFDSTKLNLARLYRKLATTTPDSHLRETYALAARDRFKDYIALAFRGRPAPPEIAQELAAMESEYAALTQPPGASTPKP